MMSTDLCTNVVCTLTFFNIFLFVIVFWGYSDEYWRVHIPMYVCAEHKPQIHINNDIWYNTNIHSNTCRLKLKTQARTSPTNSKYTKPPPTPHSEPPAPPPLIHLHPQDTYPPPPVGGHSPLSPPPQVAEPQSLHSNLPPPPCPPSVCMGSQKTRATCVRKLPVGVTLLSTTRQLILKSPLWGDSVW
jgi:hypothetical protein